MTNMGDEKRTKTTKNLSMNLPYEIIAQRLKNTTSLLYLGFPNGHIFDNRPLIIGGKVKIEVGENGLVKFLNKP